MHKERKPIIPLTALRGASTLFYIKRSPTRQALTHAYIKNARLEGVPPFNVGETTLHNFLAICIKRRIPGTTTNFLVPYWLDGVEYDPWETFLTTVQFTDDHSMPLPLTTLPPIEDIIAYSNEVLASESRLTLTDQFETLLDISGNNVVGAANIGFMASRIFARGGDTRAYPGLIITRANLDHWNSKVAQFKTYGDNQNICDGPGDTYYFWTHFFAANIHMLSNTITSKAIDHLYRNGTAIMRLTRKACVKQPTISPHREASQMGRNIGLAVINLALNLRNTTAHRYTYVPYLYSQEANLHNLL